jgi:hypothetical protein
MKYLKKFYESVIQEFLLGKTFDEVEPSESWYLLENLSKKPGPSALTESDYPKLLRLLTNYFKPELTGAELKYRSIYSLGRLDPNDIMCQANWKVVYPNEMRFDVTVTKFEDDYFFIKTEGVPVSGNTARRAFDVKYPMNDDDIFLRTSYWFIDGWDGFLDWVMSSPINESNNYDLLKYELEDYHESRKIMLIGRKTNEYRTLMTEYRKIGNDLHWYLFDDKGYNFGTFYNYDGSFKHDGSVDQFCRRKK